MNDFNLGNAAGEFSSPTADELPSAQYVFEAFAKRPRNAAHDHALFRGEFTRLKIIGETFGSKMAESVLSNAGKRLREVLADDALIGRVGEDGMVILVDGDQARAMAVAKSCIDALRAPVQIEGMHIDVGLVLGVAVFPHDDCHLLQTLENAHAAMLQARDRSLVSVHCFDSDLMQSLQSHREMASELQNAQARNELVLHYMPSVELRSGKVICVEALVRWQHPKRGLIFPEDFIPTAEANGFIVELGNWVLDRACAQLSEWHAKGLHELRVSVNFSPRQLHQGDLLNRVRSCLERTGLAPHHLEIEMTESLLFENNPQTLEILRDLKAMGVRLALDDFGTGYSSLNSLKRSPIDALKIDRTFITDITSDPVNAALTRTIFGMGQSLGLEMGAVGVETEGEFSFMQRLGCDRVQGWYVSKALPAEEFEVWLQNQIPTTPQIARNKRTLLLVDDEPNILSSLKRLLRRDGYEILTATSASAAFELLAQHEVGVVISDQRMPEMCGTEFLARVKDLNPRTVRMVLSGYTELQSVTNAINRGAIYKFLTKPWDDDNLRANVEEAFCRLEMEEQNERLHREVTEANQALSDLNRELEARVEERTRQVVRDMDHLKVAQEVLDSLPDAVFGVDDNGMVAVVNAAGAKLCEQHTEVLGLAAEEVLPTDLHAVLKECDGNAIHTHCTLKNGLSRVLCVRMGQRSRSRGKLLIVGPGREA